METSKISRFELYTLLAQEVINEGSITFRSREYLQTVFKDSATIIKGMESNFLLSNSNKLSNFLFFYEYLNENLHNIVINEFKKKIIRKFYNDYETFKPLFDSNVSFIKLFNLLVKEIVEFQNKALDSNIVIRPKTNDFSNLPQIFLSYSYNDMGLTFGLFYYFLKRKSFLYVNWMWTPKIIGGKNIKETIEKELLKSKQLLFLRSVSSELNNKGNPSIRQWCAWEIGNFYTKKQNHKYLLNMYEIARKPNELLDTFKIMSGIQDGLIY